MPVREDHIHADIPHEKTVQKEGWTYGCHSSKVGDKPRGGAGTYSVRDGSQFEVLESEGVLVGCRATPTYRMHTTEWLTHHADGRPLKCGHLEELRLKDPQCIGCVNRE